MEYVPTGRTIRVYVGFEPLQASILEYGSIRCPGLYRREFFDHFPYPTPNRRRLPAEES